MKSFLRVLAAITYSSTWKPTLIYLLFGWAGSSLVHAWAFSSCRERELLYVVVHGLLIAVTSPVGAQARGAQA